VQLTKKILLVSILFSTTAMADPTTRSATDGLSLSVGADYSNGDYGSSESTNVYYMPFAAVYNTGAFTYRLTIPYIRVTGPGDVIPGGLAGSGGGSSVVTTTNNCRSVNSGSGSTGGSGNGQKICDTVTTTTTTPAPAAATQRKRTTESGLGDISAAVTYNAVDSADWILDFTGKIKFPTGSESKGLSNGETDYALQANVEKSFGAPYVGVGLGYRWLGEPSGVNLDNVTYGSLEGGYKLTKDTTMGVSYDWATAAADGASRPQEVSVYVSHYINNNYRLNGVLYTGLSNASPDLGGGLTLSYYF
jgi:hypothetical protein